MWHQDLSPSDAKTVFASISSSTSSSTSVMDTSSADCIALAFKSVSIEDLRSGSETANIETDKPAGEKSGDNLEMEVSDHDESDDLASGSTSGSSSGSISGSSTNSSSSTKDDQSMGSDCSQDDYFSAGEKAPSVGSVLNSQKSGSKSLLADDNSPDNDGFGGFTLAQLTSTGETESPQVLESFKTSMYWCLKQL